MIFDINSNITYRNITQSMPVYKKEVKCTKPRNTINDLKKTIKYVKVKVKVANKLVYVEVEVNCS